MGNNVLMILINVTRNRLPEIVVSFHGAPFIQDIVITSDSLGFTN